MDKINWKQKLSSRKFWAAVAGFVTAIMVAFKVENGTAEQITAIITAGGVLVAYILGESAVDANRDYTNAGDVKPDTSDGTDTKPGKPDGADTKPDKPDGAEGEDNGD